MRRRRPSRAPALPPFPSSGAAASFSPTSAAPFAHLRPTTRHHLPCQIPRSASESLAVHSDVAGRPHPAALRAGARLRLLVRCRSPPSPDLALVPNQIATTHLPVVAGGGPRPWLTLPAPSQPQASLLPCSWCPHRYQVQRTSPRSSSFPSSKVPPNLSSEDGLCSPTTGCHPILLSLPLASRPSADLRRGRSSLSAAHPPYPTTVLPRHGRVCVLLLQGRWRP